MKKIVVSLACIASVMGTVAQKVFVNDANAEMRSISKSFTSIKVTGGIDLYLSQSDEVSIAVSASKNEYKESIKTEVNDGVLNIYQSGQNGWNSGNKKMKVYIAFKTLQRLEASGASDVQVAGLISGSTLDIDFSGASDFKGAVKVASLSVEVSGASDATISGTAESVTFKSSGASDIKAYDLIVDSCKAHASGASDIHITVNKELNANASGASDIYYRGEAILKEVQSSGASTIAKKN